MHKLQTVSDFHEVLVKQGLLRDYHRFHVDVKPNEVTISMAYPTAKVDNSLLEQAVEQGNWVMRSAPGEPVFHFRWHPGEPAARTEYLVSVDSDMWSTVLLIDTERGVQHAHKSL